MFLSFLELEDFFEAIRSHDHDHSFLEFAACVILFDCISNLGHVCAWGVIAFDPRVSENLVSIQALLRVNNEKLANELFGLF